MQCLGNVDGARPGQARPQDRRDQARRIETMGDPTSERRLGGKVLGQVNRVAVAGKLRKSDHVIRRHRLGQRLGHADREVLEIENLQGKRHPTDRRVLSGLRYHSFGTAGSRPATVSRRWLVRIRSPQ
jgi:hypothetical protein